MIKPIKRTGSGLGEFNEADYIGIADGGTGGVTAEAARTALDLYSKNEIDEVLLYKLTTNGTATRDDKAEVDLNTISDIGFYKITAASAQNVPKKFNGLKDGILEVFPITGKTYLVQRYTDFSGYIYLRTLSDNVWGEWKLVHAEGDVTLAVPTDFTNIADANNAVKGASINGDVIINIEDGVYDWGTLQLSTPHNTYINGNTSNKELVVILAPNITYPSISLNINKSKSIAITGLSIRGKVTSGTSRTGRGISVCGMSKVTLSNTNLEHLNEAVLVDEMSCVNFTATCSFVQNKTTFLEYNNSEIYAVNLSYSGIGSENGGCIAYSAGSGKINISGSSVDSVETIAITDFTSLSTIDITNVTASIDIMKIATHYSGLLLATSLNVTCYHYGIYLGGGQLQADGITINSGDEGIISDEKSANIKANACNITAANRCIRLTSGVARIENSTLICTGNEALNIYGNSLCSADGSTITKSGNATGAIRSSEKSMVSAYTVNITATVGPAYNVNRGGYLVASNPQGINTTNITVNTLDSRGSYIEQ